jgi:hypothetical protein
MGTTAVPTVAESADAYVGPFRDKLLSSGVIAPAGNWLVFKSDYVFNTPTGASRAVLGRNSNGWTVWKRSDGKTLDELKRK